MYQQGRDRRKTNVNTVGSRHGDSFWQAEASNTGLKMLTSMGWKQGDGLGKAGQGTTNAIKTKRKADNAGIGAKAGDADQHGFAQIATANFNDVLKRLSEANATNNVVKQPDSSDSEDDSISSGVASIGRAMARNGLYGRFRAAKDVNRYSSDAKAEIFGQRKSSPTAVRSSSAVASSTSQSPEPQTESSIITSTASVSMSDYFAQKARARAAAAAGQTTQSTAASSATSTRGFDEKDQTAYYDMISSRAQSTTSRRAGLGASSFTQEYHSITVKKEVIVKEECIKQEVVVKEESIEIKQEQSNTDSADQEKLSKRERKRIKREEKETASEEQDEEAAKRERKRMKKERKAAKRASSNVEEE